METDTYINRFIEEYKKIAKKYEDLDFANPYKLTIHMQYNTILISVEHIGYDETFGWLGPEFRDLEECLLGLEECFKEWNRLVDEDIEETKRCLTEYE